MPGSDRNFSHDGSNKGKTPSDLAISRRRSAVTSNDKSPKKSTLENPVAVRKMVRKLHHRNAPDDLIEEVINSHFDTDPKQKN